jgi:CheY-like chemotaxis protein
MARILIVEDEALIAIMLGEWLEELGHVALGPATTVGKALELIGSESIDAAIVDFHLGTERADAVADALAAKKIPFTLCSGDSSATGDRNFEGRPTISKPYDFDAVKRTVDLLVRV